MLKETYLKFKKNILPKIKKKESKFQEPKIEYCEPEQVIDICSYNHYPVMDKSPEKKSEQNIDNDIYDTSELEHEFEYGIYEDVLKTEELMAELKRLDDEDNENRKVRDITFRNFPLENFSEAGKVANEGDPHLKASADKELYELEKRAIQIDMNNDNYDNTSLEADEHTSNNDTEDNTRIDSNAGNSINNTEDTARLNTDEYSSHNEVSHVQNHEMNYDKSHNENYNVPRHKVIYGPTYVPYKEEGQKLLLPQTTDMSRKDNLKQLYNSQPHGMCSTEYDSLEQGIFDAETFSYHTKLVASTY